MTRSVGSAAVRSAQLRRAELRYGGWLRWTSLRSDHRSHAPTLRIRPPPLRIALYSAPSVARPKSGIWHCCAEPRLFVRCGLRPPPCFHPPYSPLQGFGGGRPPPRGCRHTALKIIACLLLGDSLGRERCRSLSAATQGGTTLRRVAAVDFATLRPPQPRSYATHPPSSAAHRSL